jgi:tRNA pseudouridine38-40 synthase
VGEEVTIDVRGDAFLRGMVRRMVAVLLAVGTGKLEPEAVAPMLDAREPALGGAAAPARGLTLRRVTLGRKRTQRDEEPGQDGRED